MKLLIAGSRTIPEDKIEFLDSLWIKNVLKLEEVVSGTARGADRLGENWAKFHNIPIKRFKAQWDLYGKAAGPIRNEIMGEYCDKAIIILDANLMQKSTGTWGMMKILEKLKKGYFLACFIQQGDMCISKNHIYDPSKDDILGTPITKRLGD